MVLDSSGNLAPAPRDVPVGMLPDGNGSFVPDPGWMPPIPRAGAYVPPPLPEGGELDDLVDKAQNSGQGSLNKDASGQLVEPIRRDHGAGFQRQFGARTTRRAG